MLPFPFPIQALQASLKITFFLHYLEVFNNIQSQSKPNFLGTHQKKSILIANIFSSPGLGKI